MHLRLKMGAIGSERYDRVLSLLLFLYCLALPFEEALVFPFGGIMKIIGFAVIGWCFAAHYKTTIKLRDLYFVLPFLWWFVFSVLSVVWSRDTSWWLYFVKVYASQILLVLAIASYQRFVNLEYMKNGLVAGATVAATILILMPKATVLTDDGRRTLIILGNEYDPNILASIMMIALIVTIDRIFRRKNTWLLLMAAVILLGLLFTGSRGGLISTVAGIVAYFLLCVSDRKTRRRFLGAVLIGVLLTVVILSFLPESLINSRFTLENLFGLDEYKSGSHNRWAIWSNSLPLVWNAPILGYGCGNFFYAIATVYRQCAAHNLYILVLIENGLVGLCLILWGIIRILISLKKQECYSAFAMFVAVCIMSLTLDALPYKFFWITLILAVLTITKYGEIVEK